MVAATALAAAANEQGAAATGKETAEMATPSPPPPPPSPPLLCIRLKQGQSGVADVAIRQQGSRRGGDEIQWEGGSNFVQQEEEASDLESESAEGGGRRQ